MTLDYLGFVLMAGVLIIPTHEKENWRLESYANIPANQARFSLQGIEVEVKKSASPMIYPLAQGRTVTGFAIKGAFLGLPHFQNGPKQGSKGADDYVLRVGFVLLGDRKLSGVKKLFAPTWVKNLYSLLPQDQGLDHVHFFNVTQNRQQLGQKRIHPASDLIEEEFFAFVSEPGSFAYEYKFHKGLNPLALWLSMDGDDTQSEYVVHIKSLELKD